MKKWYLSRTLWANGLAFAAVVAQAVTGKVVLSPELQAGVITVVNIVLRAVTKEGLSA